MHKILQVKTIDSGQNTDKAIAEATEALSGLVEAAQDEGWECSGGFQLYSRPNRYGTVVYLMQGMVMVPMRVANIPKPTIAELQAILDSTPSGSVEILPDGQVTVAYPPKRGPGRPPKAKTEETAVTQ